MQQQDASPDGVRIRSGPDPTRAWGPGGRERGPRWRVLGSRRWLAGGALLAASAAAVAGPWAPELRLVAEAAPRDGSRALQIQGAWPDSCVPVLLGARRDARGSLEVRLETAAGDCRPERSRYQVRVPLEAAGETAGPIIAARVFLKGENDALYRLFAFDLVAVEAPPPRFRPDSGMWWPASDGPDATLGPGVSFSFEFQGSRMAMMANVYDAYGNPTWLTASAQLEGRIVRTDLMSLAGGQALFGDYATPDLARQEARLLIAFHSRSRATLWVTAPAGEDPRSELLLQPIAIERYLFGHGAGTAALIGRWLLFDGEDAQVLDLAVDLARRQGAQSLVDRERGLRLACVAAAAAPSSLPGHCRLEGPGGELLAEFDDLGVDRLSGRSGARPVQALRLHGGR